MVVFCVMLIKNSLIYKSKLVHFVISHALKPFHLNQSLNSFNSWTIFQNFNVFALRALPLGEGGANEVGDGRGVRLVLLFLTPFPTFAPAQNPPFPRERTRSAIQLNLKIMPAKEDFSRPLWKLITRYW